MRKRNRERVKTMTHTHMYTYRHTHNTHTRAHKHTHDFALRKLRAAKCREAIEYDALENVLYLQINFPTCSRLFVCFLCVWHGAQFTRALFVLVLLVCRFPHLLLWLAWLLVLGRKQRLLLMVL